MGWLINSLLFHEVFEQFGVLGDLFGYVDWEEGVEDDVGEEGFLEAEGFQLWDYIGWLDIKVLILPLLNILLHVLDQFLQLLTTELQRRCVEQLFRWLLLLLLLHLLLFVGALLGLLHLLGFLLFLLLLACGHVLGDGWCFEDVGCEFVLIVEDAGEGAGVTLTGDHVIYY